MPSTPRLNLVAADLPGLNAAWAGWPELAAHLGAALPPDWPPDEFDRAALAWVRDRVLAGHDPAWLVYWVVLREPAPEAVGIVGFKGPPDPDGQVEIGYSIVACRRRRGLATEAAGALVTLAFTHPAVHRVLAETLPDHRASLGVLARLGFSPAGEGTEPGTVRLARERHDGARGEGPPKEMS